LICLSQKIVARIYLKCISSLSNETQEDKNLKGWAQAFRERYAVKTFNQTVNLIGGRQVDEDTMSTLINGLL
jgi:hypothetical protein